MNEGQNIEFWGPSRLFLGRNPGNSWVRERKKKYPPEICAPAVLPFREAPFSVGLFSGAIPNGWKCARHPKSRSPEQSSIYILQIIYPSFRALHIGSRPDLLGKPKFPCGHLYFIWAHIFPILQVNVHVLKTQISECDAGCPFSHHGPCGSIFQPSCLFGVFRFRCVHFPWASLFRPEKAVWRCFY